MNVLFENSHDRTKDVLKETFRYCLFRRPVFIILDILMIFVALSRIISLIIFRDFSFQLFFYFLVYAFIRVFPYYHSVRITLKRDAEAFGGSPLRIHAIVTESSIILTTSTGSKNEYLLSNIKKVSQTKNLILLRTKANMLITFPKDSFTIGTCEEFLHFLSACGIK